MRAIRLLAVLAIASTSLAAASAPKKAAPRPAAATANWNALVARTASGTHVLGNPNAKVKLGEYVSYTCSHCAEFHMASEAALRLKYVQSGAVSVEINHVLRDPVDATIAQLVNCGPSSKFLINHSMFLRSQSKWIQGLARSTPAQRNRWYTGDRATRMRAVASDFHFYDMMATRGYDRMTLDKCINDNALAERLAAISAASDKLGVDHTPSFTLNGQLLVGTNGWDLLEPQIAARL